MNEFIVQRKTSKGVVEDVGFSENYGFAKIMFTEAIGRYPQVRMIDRYSFIGDPVDSVVALWKWEDDA